MAQAGYTPIVIYHSTTGSAVPTAGNLAPGELGLNIADMKLYCENSSGVVTLLASAAGSSGDVVGPASATDNAIVRFDLTTGKLIQNSVVTIADSTGDIAGAGSITSTSASGILTRAAATQDAVAIVGRAGGTSSYAVTLTPATLSSSTTLTLPNVTDTVATIGTAQTFTAAQTFRAANAIRSEAAATQDAIVVAGRAGGTSSYAVTLTPATLSASRTFTLPDPGENVTVGYLNIPQNSQSAAYTLVATDSGKHVLHPSADTTARTFTIPANSSVPFEIGTAITFINQNGAGVVTIAITTDTMRLAGAGTTGSRTLAANGIATCIKVTSTEWIISGTGLT